MNCPQCQGETPVGAAYCCQCAQPLDGDRRKKSRRSWRTALLLVIVPVLAFFLAGMIGNVQSAVERGRTKRTAADIRTIATAWETYATERGSVCPAGWYTAGFDWGNLPPRVVHGLLGRAARESLNTLTDGWGQPFEFAVSCEDQSYGVRSRGPDGIWATDVMARAVATQYDYDIVFIDGCFCLGGKGYCPP